MHKTMSERPEVGSEGGYFTKFSVGRLLHAIKNGPNQI